MREGGCGRINFLAESGFSFNYRTMALAFGAIMVFFLLLAGAQGLRYYYYEESLKRNNNLMAALEKEKEMRLSQVEILGAKQATSGEYKDLYSFFQRPVPWSEVMEKLAKVVPAGLWLNAMESDLTKDDKVYLSLKGGARNSKAISFFLMGLQSEPLFNEVQLVNSKDNEMQNEFEYSIKLRVVVSR